MGSGKTTIGQLIAKRLDIAFRDTDQVVEEETGRSVSDIFLEDGEDAFRLLEKGVLRG
jgi:shikimate kinase